MRALIVFALALALLTSNAALASSTDDSEPPAPALRYGTNAATIDAQTAAGVKPDYATFWIGPWTLTSGWGGPKSLMSDMRSQGITPAIHFYYWGDDISPSCIENGCWSDLHGAWKDQEGWDRLAKELVHNLNETMKGDPVLVFMETEFNKGGMHEWEPLDGHMANKSRFIKKHYPAAQTVMALGNWDRSAWPTFEKFANASDYMGIQGMRGSTRDSLSSYRYIFDDTIKGVDELARLWDKPIMILDIALSSYPDEEYLDHQAYTLETFFTGLDRLKTAGVEGIIYRHWYNAKNMNTDNYYGEAERHWGLHWDRSSGPKPSGQVWIAGVQADREGRTYQSPLPPEDRPFEVEFQLSPNISEWWIQTRVETAHKIARVDGSVNGGKWNELTWQDWGAWAASFHAPEGSSMVLRATNTDGEQISTQPFAWMQEEPTTEPPPPLEAAFTVHAEGLTVYVDGSESSAPDGEGLEYSWDFGDGNTASGATVSHTYQQAGNYQILLSVSDGKETDTATQTVAAEEIQPLGATYRLSKNVHEWWVEVFIDANNEIHRVQVKIDDGSWKDLDKKDWGSWAKSLKTPEGSQVVFRSTDEHGQHNLSKTYTWLEKPVEPPVADFVWSTQGLNATMDASGSSDPQGRELTYTWDLGDGATADGPSIDHAYPVSGTYTVRLTVDNGEKKDTLERAVTVKAPPPVAEFNATVKGLQVLLDASGSYDPLGRDLEHHWEFDDGTNGTEPQVEHTYKESGTYHVRLTVKNGEDENTTSQEIVVEAPPPEPEFQATTEGLRIRVDGSGSRDPLGRKLLHYWDLGDGTNGTGAQFDHMYGASGTYNVTLTVSNGEHENTTSQEITVEALAPTADFDLSADHLEVSFDASPSSDPQGWELEHHWDYGDGSYGTGQQTDHTYEKSGTYTVTLTVKNGERENTTIRNLTVEAPEPVADFRTATDHLSVALDANRSFDPLGRELTYTWDLGDGNSAQGRQATHTYDQSGTYTVTLTVSNGEHANTTSRNVSVEAPPPQAAFEHKANDLLVTLDANGSSDPLGRELTYTWDLGDGNTAQGEKIDHTYDATGNYTVTLTVSNGEHEDSTSQNVSVQAPPPTAAFTAETDGLNVSLDASGSSDPLGRNLTYTWGLGDGNSAQGRQATHTYDQSGTYTVTLTVSNGEHANSTTRNVSVEAPPPQAAFEHTADDLRATLDASGSTDPLGRNLTYTWDLGDGNSATGEQVTHTYNQSGTYTVTLTVGNGEHEDSTSQNVSVQASPPTAAFTAETDGLNVSLDASGSSDPLGRNLTYTWDLGDGNTAQGQQVTHTYDQGGTYTVTLSVSNGDQEDQRDAQVSVEAPPEPLEASFRLSKNVNEWWVEVFVEANHPIDRVQARVDDGSWKTLEKKGWGSWAASMKAPQGSSVVFQVTDVHGQRVLSESYTWMQEDADPNEEEAQLDPTFRVSNNVNEWWVEVFVDADRPIDRVQARVDGGAWKDLEKKDWGSWAASMKAPEGSQVEFLATDDQGAQVHSPTYTWLTEEDPQEPTEPEGPEPLEASFRVGSGSHNWWVEAYVSANHPIERVQVRVDDGAWRDLHKKDWGAWADSFWVPDGAQVVFQATDEHGQVAGSATYTW